MTSRGDQQRAKALDRAVQSASVEGLEGVSLGQLARNIGMSKSGVAGLFGTKVELQLAVVAAARSTFLDRVFGGHPAPHGVARLRQIMARWVAYLDVFEGGCFFSAAAAEFDGRPGPVRDAVLEVTREAGDRLVEQIRLAVRLGEFSSDTDVDQVAFELHAAVLEANLAKQLLGDRHAFRRARMLVQAVIDRHSVE